MTKEEIVATPAALPSSSAKGNVTNASAEFWSIPIPRDTNHPLAPRPLSTPISPKGVAVGLVYGLLNVLVLKVRWVWLFPQFILAYLLFDVMGRFSRRNVRKAIATGTIGAGRVVSSRHTLPGRIRGYEVEFDYTRNDKTERRRVLFVGEGQAWVLDRFPVGSTITTLTGDARYPYVVVDDLVHFTAPCYSAVRAKTEKALP